MSDNDPSAESLSKAVRWERLLALLADRKRLSVTGVAEELGISESTVRRDFDTLAARQLATRTHGGVVATTVAYGLPARYRERADAKQRIARAASDLIPAGAVVGLNGGTTTTAVAKALSRRTDLPAREPEPALTVVTTALNIAADLVLRPQIRTVCVGGTARPQSYELVGPMAIDMVRRLWLDILVFGMVGIDATAGATCQDPTEAGVTWAMVEQSRRTVAVATSDKVGIRAFARLCPIERITTLITDTAADPVELAALKEAGVEVVTV